MDTVIFREVEMNFSKLSNLITSSIGNSNVIYINDTMINKPKNIAKAIQDFQRGSRIVIRKNNITLEDAYNILQIPHDNELINSTNSPPDYKLKPIAILLSRDSLGNVHSNIISVDKFNDKGEIESAIKFALKSPLFIGSLATNKTKLTWTSVATNTWTDCWSTAYIQYSIVLQKNPNNLNGKKAYSFIFSEINITPKNSYASGDVYIYHSNDKLGEVYEYKPIFSSNAYSINESISLSPAVSLSYKIGATMTLSKESGGIGSSDIQWKFSPFNLSGVFYPVKSKTHYETISEYSQDTNLYKGGLSYKVRMYKVLAGNFQYYATANKSNIYVSGY